MVGAAVLRLHLGRRARYCFDLRHTPRTFIIRVALFTFYQLSHIHLCGCFEGRYAAGSGRGYVSYLTASMLRLK